MKLANVITIEGRYSMNRSINEFPCKKQQYLGFGPTFEKNLCSEKTFQQSLCEAEQKKY